MGERIAIAFAGAALVVLVVGSVLRAIARRRKGGRVRQLGGIALLIAAPVGLLAAVAVPERALVVVGGALVLGAFGIVRDSVRVPQWLVALVVTTVAVVVTTSGLRFPLGGVPAVDFVWTVAWLVLVTSAVANSGNADGQFPSLAAASAFGIMAIAGFAGQSATATVAAALLGGLLAFLAFNFRPASLYVGRTGAWCTGFLIAAGALWARPSIGQPGALLVSAMLVAVALLDGTLVVLSRLRRRRKLGVRLRDHLAHRMVAAGMRPSRSIRMLTGVQLVISVVAVFVARGVLGLGIGAAIAGALLLVVAVIALRAKMRDVGGVPGFSWRVRLVFSGVVVLVLVGSFVAAASALSSRTRLLAARDAANDAVVAASNGNSARAVELFAQAERDFEAADERLGSFVNVPSLVVPVVGSNMYAARELTRVGLELSRAGRRVTEQINSDELHFVDGRIPLESVATIAPELDDAAKVLSDSRDSIDALRTGFLVGEMADGIRELSGDLTDAARNADTAARTAGLAPAVLGQEGQRRYLLVVQNPAELRGTGGLVGNYGILTAQDGKVDLESIDRLRVLQAAAVSKTLELDAPQEYVDRYARFDPARSFQNANITPDFPTAAAVQADLYAQIFGAPVDGVIAVDPVGLQALLSLTGPVRVDGWRTPINAQNVIDVTLRDAYAAFAETPDRADFLGDVARAAIDRATAGDLGSLERLSTVLGKAAHQGHFSVWMANPEEQAVVEPVEVSGRTPAPARGDSLLVSNTNAGANKLDYYLDRKVSYSVTVSPSPDLERAAVAGTVSVDLGNTAPATGLPRIVAGPYDLNGDMVYGQNRSFVSLYSPLSYTGASVGGQPRGLEVAQELGRNVFSTYVDVFAQQATNFSVDVAGIVGLRDGWYDLTLIHQPTLRPTPATVRVAVPEGFRIVDARGGLEVVDGVAQGTVPLDQTRTVRVKIASAPGAGLWDRLRRGA